MKKGLKASGMLSIKHLLDIISQGEDIAYMNLTEEADEYKYKLEFKEYLDNGGLYQLSNEYFEFDVWLCHVVKFVYGYIPTTLYLV